MINFCYADKERLKDVLENGGKPVDVFFSMNDQTLYIVEKDGSLLPIDVTVEEREKERRRYQLQSNLEHIDDPSLLDKIVKALRRKL